MFWKKISFLVCLMGIFSLKSNAQLMNDAVQVIIMRHAEKVISDNPDPDLSAEGKARAERVAKMLSDVKVDRLFATPYKRTQQTLAPLAASKQLTIENYNPAEMQKLAEQILNEKGKTIVIAGHSNTVPQLANLLLKESKYTNIPDDEFGKVWILTLSSGKASSCLLLNTD